MIDELIGEDDSISEALAIFGVIIFIGWWIFQLCRHRE
jgi:hypothetical protein